MLIVLQIEKSEVDEKGRPKRAVRNIVPLTAIMSLCDDEKQKFVGDEEVEQWCHDVIQVNAAHTSRAYVSSSFPTCSICVVYLGLLFHFILFIGQLL